MLGAPQFNAQPESHLSYGPLVVAFSKREPAFILLRVPWRAVGRSVLRRAATVVSQLQDIPIHTCGMLWHGLRQFSADASVLARVDDIVTCLIR